MWLLKPRNGWSRGADPCQPGSARSSRTNPFLSSTTGSRRPAGRQAVRARKDQINAERYILFECQGLFPTKEGIAISPRRFESRDQGKSGRRHLGLPPSFRGAMPVCLVISAVQTQVNFVAEGYRPSAGVG